MEPLLVGGVSRDLDLLNDLALDLARKSTGFRRSIPPSLLRLE